MDDQHESATRVAGAPATSGGTPSSAGTPPSRSSSPTSPSVLADEWVLRGCATVEEDGQTFPLLGRVALIERIGKGGMGVVYRGRNPRLGTEVAVKVLPPSLEKGNDGFAERFVREARIAARLRSEHLVSVIDVDRDAPSGCHFLVMEYVHGTTAAQWVHDLVAAGRPNAREADALELTIAATRGLAAAHAEGIVHRDVKPGNILIPAGPDGRPNLGRAKLADLGLARGGVGEDSLTATETALGTPGYMAPEQAQDSHRAGKPADVFSMGATLYAFLTGNAPFRGSTPVEAIVRTVKGEFKSLADVRRDVSAATAALVEKCLAPEPAQRFADAATLLRALEVCRGALGAGPSEAAAAAVRVAAFASTDEPPTVAGSLKTRAAAGPDTATCAPPAGPRPAKTPGPATRTFAPPAERATGGRRGALVAAALVLVGLGVVAAIAIPSLAGRRDGRGQSAGSRGANASVRAPDAAPSASEEAATAGESDANHESSHESEHDGAVTASASAPAARSGAPEIATAPTAAAPQRLAPPAPAAPAVRGPETPVAPVAGPARGETRPSADAEETLPSDPLEAAQRFDLSGLPGREDSYTEQQLRERVRDWRKGDLAAALDLQRRLAQFYFRIGETDRARTARARAETLERRIAERAGSAGTGDSGTAASGGPAPGPSSAGAAPSPPAGAGPGAGAPPPPPPPPPPQAPPPPPQGPPRGR